MPLARLLGTVKTLAYPVGAAAAYTSGDQLGVLTKLSNAFEDNSGMSLLQSLAVNDAAKQKAAMDIYFFSDAPTVTSVDNGAADIAASEMATKCLGSVNIPAANYKDLANDTIATVTNIQLMLKNTRLTTSSGQGDSLKDLWVYIVVRGTPTYVATTDLKITLGIAQY